MPLLVYVCDTVMVCGARAVAAVATPLYSLVVLQAAANSPPLCCGSFRQSTNLLPMCTQQGKAANMMPPLYASVALRALCCGLLFSLFDTHHI